MYCQLPFWVIGHSVGDTSSNRRLFLPLPQTQTIRLIFTSQSLVKFHWARLVLRIQWGTSELSAMKQRLQHNALSLFRPRSEWDTEHHALKYGYTIRCAFI